MGRDRHEEIGTLMKNHSIAQQNDIAFGILGQTRQFAAFGLAAQSNAQLNNHGLGFNQ
jgi:hypothetical protein